MKQMEATRNITEHKQTENILSDSESSKWLLESLNLSQQIAKIGSWDWDVHSNHVWWSDETYRIFGVTPEHFIPSFEANSKFIHPEDLSLYGESFNLSLKTGKPIDFDIRLVTEDGLLKYCHVKGKVILDDLGQPSHFIGTILDITERKKTEEQIQTSLSEKEVLLREVHHRVKNNMAAIIGLLDLQRQVVDDPQYQTIMTSLSSRVRAMSLVHEKLYRSDSLSKIDFQEYLQALISHLRTSFGSPNIRCNINAIGVEMPLDLAVPCGMIVNELIINALKYAFPKERSGIDCEYERIVVAVTHNNNCFTLTVADNGVGLPPGFDLNTTTTLGLSLVQMLGQHQLGGQYEIDQTGGTQFTLTFSLQDGGKPYA